MIYFFSNYALLYFVIHSLLSSFILLSLIPNSFSTWLCSFTLVIFSFLNFLLLVLFFHYIFTLTFISFSLLSYSQCCLILTLLLYSPYIVCLTYPFSCLGSIHERARSREPGWRRNGPLLFTTITCWFTGHGSGHGKSALFFSTLILTPYFLFLISYSLFIIRNLLRLRF